MKLHTQLNQARTASKSHLKIALVHFSYKNIEKRKPLSFLSASSRFITKQRSDTKKKDAVYLKLKNSLDPITSQDRLSAFLLQNREDETGVVVPVLSFFQIHQQTKGYKFTYLQI